MLSTLIAWLYIFLLTGGLGIMQAACWARIGKGAIPALPVYQFSLLGFAALTILLGFYSLLAPINAVPHVLLTLSVLAFAYFCPSPFLKIWQQRKRYSRQLLFIGCLIAAIYILNLLFWTTKAPSNDDTGFYHSQTIKWLEHFPAVPGLGNLHGRLAFNSSFLQWSALFSFTFLTGQPLFVLNGYLFLLLLAAFLPPMLRNAGEARPYHLVTATLFILHLDFFAGWISSPTPDIAGMLLVCFITHLALAQREGDPRVPGTFAGATILLLIFTSLTIKLSTLPVLGLIVYLAFSKTIPFRPRPVLYLGLAMALFMVPWIGRNILQTGYFIYPLPVLDIWQVDWKIPLEAVIVEKNIIHSAAIRVGNDWQQVLALPFWEWFPAWFRGHSGMYQLFLLSAAVSPVPMLLYWVVNKPAYPASPVKKQLFGLWMVYYAGFLFWFMNAPSIRFGSAFLYLSWLLPLYWWLLPVIKKYQAFLQGLLLVFLLGYGLERLRDPVYQVRHQTAGMPQRLWLPEPQPQPALRRVPVHQGQVWVPVQGVLCWYGPLPCTFLVPQGLAFRGKSLAEGFRIEKSGE